MPTLYFSWADIGSPASDWGHSYPSNGVNASNAAGDIPPDGSLFFNTVSVPNSFVMGPIFAVKPNANILVLASLCSVTSPISLGISLYTDGVWQQDITLDTYENLGAWEDIESAFTVPDGITQCHVKIVFGAAGWVAWDEVTVTDVDIDDEKLPPLSAIDNATIEILGAQSETVRNGSFELVDDVDATYPYPNDWEGYPDRAYVISVPEVPTDGVRSLWLGVHSVGHFVYQHVQLEPGKAYRLSASAGGNGGPVPFSINLVDPNAGHVPIARLDWPAGTPRPPVASMLRKSLTFIAPAGGTVQVEVGVGPQGATGTDWNIDAVSIVLDAAAWVDVTPQSMVVKVGWGADDPQGLLTVPASGHWSVRTYDPHRKLDPANSASPNAAFLRPGRPMRIGVISPDTGYHVVRQGLLDEVTYDVYTKQGTMRGTDIVPLIVAAKIPAAEAPDPAMPDTLRARARYLLDKVGLGTLVPVEGLGNLLTNPSFEDGNTGWTNQGSSIVPAPSQTRPIHGARVWQVSGGTMGYPKGIQQVPALAGATYTLTGYFMRAGGGTVLQPTAFITARSFNGAQAGGSVPATGTGAIQVWQPFTCVYTAPDDGTIATVEADLRINAATTGSGDHVWFDDIVMTEVLPGYDPIVGPLPFDRDLSVWAAIGTSAYDALYAMWIDRLGVLRFRSFGSPRDNGFQIGGTLGIPISTLKTQASIQNIYTLVRAFDMDAPEVPVQKQNDASIDVYGVIPLTREKPVPDAEFWATNVLNDRAGAALQYETGTLYPRTQIELRSLIDLEMIETAHIVADDIVPPLDITARVLGARLTADTDTGWTAEVVTYIPASEWEDAAVPPEPPIEPEPPATHQETRYYNATKDSRAARNASGTNMGSGTEGELPVGSWQGWRNRAFIAFASIPWGDVESIDQCVLELDTSSQVNVGFGSSPKVIVARVTEGWGEGSSSSPSTSNSLKYPGPSATSTNQKTQTITRSENASVGIDITAIARDWKNGVGTYGLRIISAGEDSDKYTSEFWSRENSSSGRRPRLRLVVQVRNATGKPA